MGVEWVAGPDVPDERPAPGRSTRPMSAKPAAGSAQWCIDGLLTTRCNDASGNGNDATSLTTKDGRRSSPSPAAFEVDPSRPG